MKNRANDRQYMIFLVVPKPMRFIAHFAVVQMRG